MRAWGMALLLAARTSALGAPAGAQARETRTHALDTVVVTAERAPTAIGRTPSTVSRLTRERIARIPQATLADVLRQVPGFAVVSFDGLGFDPQLMVRGFYGGGEAEYVVVLVDGHPVNQLHTGVVAWDALPPGATVDAVEVVRGSASALYGDAALGGVINIITRHDSLRSSLDATLGGGSFGGYRASGGARGSFSGRNLSGVLALDHTDGFRAHGSRSVARQEVNVALLRPQADRRFDLSLRHYARWFDEPGALLESLTGADRSASDALFRFDHTRDHDFVAGLDGTARAGGHARLGASVSGEQRHVNAVRTLALAPGFGDTKEREFSSTLGHGTIQLDVDDSPLPGVDHLTLGVDVGAGSLDSKYFKVLTGPRSAYRLANGRRGALDASGDVSRETHALYAQYAVQPAAAVRFTLGGRADALRDELAPRAPSTGARLTTSHHAFSPKAGLSLRLRSSDRASGQVYLSASRSFKAPTLDQLFDQRSIPVPFPPFSITTSNASLHPQHGNSLEGGITHSAILDNGVRTDVSVSVYQIAMKDELDFDVQTLRYVNIGRSRHRGVEAGLSAGFSAATLVANYTRQAVTARSGDFAGHDLKAIPRHVISGGVYITPRAPVDASFLLTSARKMYLDDANTRPLASYTRADAQIGYRFGWAHATLGARNLLATRYSSTGYLDPSGSGEAYFYPAAGRVIDAALRASW